MKTRFTLFLFLGLTLFSYGQFEKLNQLDANGKKHGKWIVYLGKNWEKVKDSTVAVYLRYNMFDHGVSIYPMGPCGRNNWKLEIKSNGNTNTKFLDGEYKWVDEKGRVRSIHVLQNGEYISCKEFYKTGEVEQHFDYTKQCQGQQYGWVVYGYDKKGNLKFDSWMCKDKDGHWPKSRG